MEKILITGSMGQIGSELLQELRKIYGKDNVIASDFRTPTEETRSHWEPFERIDVTNQESLANVVKKYNIDTIFHLAALLSAVGEQNPQKAWNVNMGGLYNVLEVAREYKVEKIFNPTSIAAFGPGTPRDMTPQDTILTPTTMYGVTKVSGELLCDYYVRRFDMDVRGVRFPGIISSETPPGGGTTDYAVAIFYDAVKTKKYTCFVTEDTVLPMMYMPDAIHGVIKLMQADKSRLKHHSNFNLASMSFSAKELVAEIQKHIPEFTCEYKPDFRQQIADSWPRSLDDSVAREEWDWKPTYDISSMTTDMLEKLTIRYKNGQL